MVWEILGSLALIGMSIGVVAECLRMPVRGNFLVSGGAFPFLLGLGLIGLGCVWLIGSLRTVRGREAWVREIKAPLAALQANWLVALRIGALLGLALLYVYVLTPWLGFGLATFVFLLATLLGLARLRLVIGTATALVVTAVIYLGFRYMLMIPLP